MAGAPPNSLHYMAIGVNPFTDGVQSTGQVTAIVFPKYETFDPGADIKTDDDEGHTGTDILLLGKDRTEATGAPKYKDKIRMAEGYEDILFLLLGTMDGVVPAITNATTAKKWVLYRDVSDPVELPWATVWQGFNWSTAKAEAYVEAMVNGVDWVFDPDKSPTFEVSFLSDFPLYNQTEPTRTFPETEYRFKGGQTTIYMGPANTSQANLINNTYKLDCYTNASLSVKNNLEASICGGTSFGQSNKDQKPLTGSGKIKMEYNTANMTLEAEWATGSTSGTAPSEDSLYKAIAIQSTGKLIETVNSTPVYMDQIIYLPKVEVGKPESPRAGKDKKTVEFPFDIVNDNLTDPITITLISPLAAIHYGTAV